MSDDIMNQLKDLAASLKRGEGRSTVYGAVTEIEYLRDALIECESVISRLKIELAVRDGVTK